MEILNYSLWFTLVWWSINVTSVMFVQNMYMKQFKNKEPWDIPSYPLNFMSELFTMVMIPAPIILLEYLIMR